MIQANLTLDWVLFKVVTSKESINFQEFDFSVAKTGNLMNLFVCLFVCLS